MRAALIVSAVVHFMILAGMLVTLPDAEGFSTPSVDALPVELVTIDEETDVTLGRVDAEEVLDEAAPQTVEADAPAEPDTTPGANDAAAEEIATDENARVDAPESSAPEPAGLPEPVEAPAPPEETPPATDVAAADPLPEPPAPEAEAPAPVPETVVPSRKPRPPRRTEQARLQRPNENSFDANRLSQLINRTDPSGGGSGSAQASLGAASGRAAAPLTLSEKDALRSQMQRCWNPPIAVRDGTDVAIIVEVRLFIDGSVEAIDSVGAQGVGRLYDVAADSARRAVLQCQPYRLPTSKYAEWKAVQVTFDPRDLLR
ncbi:MAG: cell envelope biogenesis protein TolA [Pseudomonadota bacterium]